MDEKTIKKLNKLEDYLCDLSLDLENALENAREELNDLYDLIEEKEKYSIKDIDNFKRELKREGLYTEELDNFIEQYMIYYNK